MSQEAFAAQPGLKEKMVTAADGETTTEQLVEVVNSFLNSQVYLPSVEQPGEDGSVNPLMLQDTDENPVMPLFSSPEEIPAEYTEQAPHVAVVSGVGVLQAVTNASIIIDPGADHQFPLSLEQMAAIREQIAGQLDEDPQQG